MPVNLHLARIFFEVVRRNGFSAAGETLHISQPAVSRGVRELEQQIGDPLLQRGSGGVSLTAAGAILYDHCALIFAAEHDAEIALAELKGLRRGELRVGASTTIATYLLPPVLGRFHIRHPAVELHLVSANTDAIAAQLVAREIDVALVEGPVERQAVSSRPWIEDRLILICAPTHRLATMTAPIDSRALAEHTHIVREPGSGTRVVVAAALAAAGIEPARVMEIGDTEAIKQIVAAGLGVAFVSEAAVYEQVALGTLVTPPVRGLEIRRELSVLSRGGRQPTAAAAAFEALLFAGS